MSIPDESRYAEIPREMIVSGDWIVPHLNGMRYFEKPILGYWINAISILVFGENNFAIRLPSALSVFISAFLIFLLVRKFDRDDRKAALSAAAFLTCILVFAIGVFNVLDSMFALFITGTMVFFFFATQESEIKQRNLLLTLCGVCCGLAFLTKGFLAFALPVIGILPFMLWEKRAKDIFKFAWLPAIVAVLVISPWAVLIHLREKDFWFQFFWVEHIRRFFSPNNIAQHAKPCWFFVPVLAIGLFPWIMLVPTALSGMRRKGFLNPLSRFTICWFIFFFLFFSASSGKLATYILPCFPPLMILIIDGLLKHLEQGRSWLFFGTTVITAVLMATASLFLVTSQTFDSMDNLRVYWDEEVWKWRILAAGFGVFSISTLLASNKSDIYKQIKLYSMAPLLLLFAVHFTVPKTFRFISKECMDPVGMIESHMDKIEPNSVILSDDYFVHAVCWVSKRTNIYLFENAGELKYGLSYNDSKRHCIQPEQLRYLTKRAKRTVTLITNTTDYERYGDRLPKPFYIENTNGFVFAQYRYERKDKK